MGYIGAGPTRFNTADELTVTGDAEFNGDLTVKGTHITLDSATVQTVDLGDNDKIRLGDSDDLQIYHDGSNSYVQENGTGTLNIQGTNLALASSAGEYYLFGSADGATTLYYDNAAKLATTNTGVDVTGTVTADGLTVDTNTLHVDATNNRVGIGTTSPSETLHVEEATTGNAVRVSRGGNYIIMGGSGSGTQYVKGYEGTIAFGNAFAGNTTFLTSDTERMRIDSGGITTVGGTSGAARLNAIASNWSENALAVYSANVAAQTNFAGMGFFNQDADSPIGQVADIYTNPTGTLSLTASGNPAIQLKYGSFGISGGTPALTVDNAGRIGIGTSSPDSESLLDLGSGENSGYTRKLLVTNTGNSRAGLGALSNIFRVFYADDQAVQFGTVSRDGAFTFIEKMRLDSSGSVFVAKTATNFATAGIEIRPVGAIDITRSAGSPLHLNRTSSVGEIANFYYNGAQVGSITVAASSTAYNTSSDYRLKTAVNYDWDATSRLKQLRPARFEWIVDGDDAVPVDGFLAHEVQDIVPEAISGTKDAMRDEEYQVSAATGDIYTPAIDAVLDEDGNEVTPAVAEVIHSTDVEQPEELAEGQQWRETTAAVMGTRSVPDYQGIDQSKLVPLLVKTIQELEARITALETA